MTGTVIRTVLGDVDPSGVGIVDYHEHLFQTSPLLPGDELDDEGRSGIEAQSLADAGVMLMVEATPTGLGRDPAAVARISGRTGMAIVHVTGAHHAGHYAQTAPILAGTTAQLARRFIRDIEDGFSDGSGDTARAPHGEPVRAGMVKAGVRYWSIGAFERRVLEASAQTSRRTGCAIMVHLDYGSAAHEVLDILEDSGVTADRVVLAHVDRNLDAGLHTSLAQRGAYLGYDGMARHKRAPDSEILRCLAQVAGTGSGARHLVLGGDVARSSRYVAYGGMPGLAYLPRRFVPRLERLVSAEAFRCICADNAIRLLSLAGRGEHGTEATAQKARASRDRGGDDPPSGPAGAP